MTEKRFTHFAKSKHHIRNRLFQLLYPITENPRQYRVAFKCEYHLATHVFSLLVWSLIVLYFRTAMHHKASVFIANFVLAAYNPVCKTLYYICEVNSLKDILCLLRTFCGAFCFIRKTAPVLVHLFGYTSLAFKAYVLDSLAR